MLSGSWITFYCYLVIIQNESFCLITKTPPVGFIGFQGHQNTQILNKTIYPFANGYYLTLTNVHFLIKASSPDAANRNRGFTGPDDPRFHYVTSRLLLWAFHKLPPNSLNLLA